MDIWEKLVELLNKANSACVGTDCFEGCKFYAENDCLYKLMADVMIAHGVTLQEWISVKDRLPEQGQEVIVYDGGVLKPKVYCYLFWNKDYDSWARVTHWMPLPQPPKGE